MKTRPGHVALAAVMGWTILGCVFAVPDLSAGTGWRRALLFSLALWWSWGIVTPLILWADRQIPISSKQLADEFLAHFLPSLLVDVCVRLSVWGGSRRARIAEWNGLPSIQVLVDALRGHVSLELAQLLADPGSPRKPIAITITILPVSCVWSVWKKASPRLV